MGKPCLLSYKDGSSDMKWDVICYLVSFNKTDAESSELK